MRSRLLAAILRRVESAGADADLLARFRHTRDQEAFAELVCRHGRLVWSVCRNMLAAEADAEDAFQATFLALSRSADRIREGQAVAGWLHAAAVRVCLQYRRTVARRQRREQQAAIGEADSPVAESRWEAVHAAVHEEVLHLPDGQRAAFVLCCLEGRGQTEAAELLGWKLGTLSGRLTRAKQTILSRLDRRGVLPAAGLAVTATADAPAKAVQMAMTLTGYSTTVLELARGATEGAMRGKVWAAVLVAGALTASGGGVWLTQTTAQDRPADPRPVVGGKLTIPDAVAQTITEVRSGYDTFRPMWEYQTLKVDSRNQLAFTEWLKKLGRDGWELCGSELLYPPPSNEAVPHLIFKRPLRVPAGISFVDPGLSADASVGGTVPGMGNAINTPPPPAKKVQIITLKHAAAVEVAKVLREVFGTAQLRTVSVSAEPTSNSLILNATEQQSAEVMKLVTQLDEIAAKQQETTRELADQKRKQSKTK